jgi:hypothetical protein
MSLRPLSSLSASLAAPTSTGSGEPRSSSEASDSAMPSVSVHRSSMASKAALLGLDVLRVNRKGQPVSNVLDDYTWLDCNTTSGRCSMANFSLSGGAPTEPISYVEVCPRRPTRIVHAAGGQGGVGPLRTLVQHLIAAGRIEAGVRGWCAVLCRCRRAVARCTGPLASWAHPQPLRLRASKPPC